VASHRFARIQPNSSYRDYSRLSCAAGEMPLGSRVAGIFSKRYAPTLAIERHRCKARIDAVRERGVSVVFTERQEYLARISADGPPRGLGWWRRAVAPARSRGVLYVQAQACAHP
jgi:hypothetical protein